MTEAKKNDEFLKYMMNAGLIDQMTKILVGLH